MASRSTLLRYARLQRPRVHDLANRAKDDPELRALASRTPGEQTEWAQTFLKGSEELGTGSRIGATYISFLRAGTPVDRLLPGSGDVDPERRSELSQLPSTDQYREDLAYVLKAALALKLVGRDSEAEAAARFHQLIERLPTLSARSPRIPYAPPVVERYTPKPRSGPVAGGDEPGTTDEEPKSGGKAQPEDPERLLEDLGVLWRLRNRALREARAEATRSDKAGLPAEARRIGLPVGARPAAKGMADEREAVRQAGRAHFEALREHRQQRAERLLALKEQEADHSVASMLTADPDVLARFAGGLEADQIKEMQDRLGSTGLLKPYEKMSFCQAYETVKAGMDSKPGSYGKPKASMAGCFQEMPTLAFGDDVQLMGLADLIKVEEQLIGYSEGEISYVENILAGERRYREVKALREFEQTDVEAVQESKVTTREKSATTSQTLASEVAQAVATRFSSDVSASASASGGGNIGVVSIQGEGALDIGVGLGVDTSFSSSERSEFGSDIIDAATEAVTRATQTSRTIRARTLFRTLDQHEIDNSGDNPSHRRGVYCFLNKHVCITETPYGTRWFLKATVALPGRNLICERLTRIAYALGDLDRPPDFTITPADIHPSNYLELAGRFRAQGVSPPPPPIRHLGRTYKTDQTNLTTEQAQGLEKLGQAAMPLFKAYKRHLVSDTIAVPDGYMVQEVRLAICHGANGLSVPADLPLKLGAAGLMAVPTLFAYPLFLLMPAALWQVLLLASPVLHHNTDSSAVTATIGAEAQESSYYFFDADFLIAEILQLFGSFSAMGQAIMDQIRQMVADLPATLNARAQQLSDAVEGAVEALVAAVQGVFDSVGTALNNVNLAAPDIPALISAITDAFTQFGAFVTSSVPANLFGPLNTFFQDVVDLIAEAAESAMSDLMAALLAGADNNQERAFAESFGATGELPVSLNVVSIKAGVTVNLVACLARTPEALDAWRLEVFGKLYQSYLQLAAEYESKRFLGTRSLLARSPGSMRLEEQEALRNVIIHALNGVWPSGGPQNQYDFDRLNLFEHAIDWDNMTYRLYNYGPDVREVGLDHRGVFSDADDRRRDFLTAAWAQVMLPLSAEPALERAMLAYFGNGSTAIGADLSNDELAALWADAIARRDLYAEHPEPISTREVTLPTDHIVLRTDDSLPANLPTACSA